MIKSHLLHWQNHTRWEIINTCTCVFSMHPLGLNYVNEASYSNTRYCSWHVGILLCYVYHACNYPHSPSLSRMVTVAVSPPGINEAGAATLPETTKLSVPSTKESSMILTEAFWVLPEVAPW